MKTLLKEEKGSAIILAALSMVVLLGFAALAIDGGNLYFRHMRLQDTADACALAACQQLVVEKGNDAKKRTEAFNQAINYANKNGLTASASASLYSANVAYGDETGSMEVSFPDATKEVKVDIKINSNLYFARVLGFNQTPVAVSATARSGQAGEQTGNLVPLSFFWQDYVLGQTYELNLEPGAAQSGNFGYLDYQPSNMFDDYIEDGYGGTLRVGQKVYTYPGASIGLIAPAIENRINRCKALCTQDNIEPNCPRSVIVPIVNDLLEEDTHGNTLVTISGFARFFIIGYDKSAKTLTGVFVEEVDSSVIIGDDAPEYMVQSVRLIK